MLYAYEIKYGIKIEGSDDWIDESKNCVGGEDAGYVVEDLRNITMKATLDVTPESASEDDAPQVQVLKPVVAFRLATVRRICEVEYISVPALEQEGVVVHDHDEEAEGELA